MISYARGKSFDLPLFLLAKTDSFCGIPWIVAKPREAERLLAQAKTVEDVCKEIDVTDAAIHS